MEVLDSLGVVGGLENLSVTEEVGVDGRLVDGVDGLLGTVGFPDLLVEVGVDGKLDKGESAVWEVGVEGLLGMLGFPDLLVVVGVDGKLDMGESIVCEVGVSGEEQICSVVGSFEGMVISSGISSSVL